MRFSIPSLSCLLTGVFLLAGFSSRAEAQDYLTIDVTGQYGVLGGGGPFQDGDTIEFSLSLDRNALGTFEENPVTMDDDIRALFVQSVVKELTISIHRGLTEIYYYSVVNPDSSLENAGATYLASSPAGFQDAFAASVNISDSTTQIDGYDMLFSGITFLGSLYAFIPVEAQTVYLTQILGDGATMGDGNDIATVTMSGADSGGGPVEQFDFAVNSVVVAVPEPGGAILMGGAFLCALFRRRRPLAA